VRCDGDSAINCLQKDWSCEDTSTYSLSIKDDQFSGPGQMVIDLATDTPNDPTIKSINEVTNDTPAAWVGYIVNVTLDVPTPLTPNSYSLSPISSPSNQIVSSPGDWTATIRQALTYAGRNGSQYEYAGEIDMAGGTAVANGDELDFSYELTFAGATTYRAIQQQTPIDPQIVPEPGTLMMVLSGLLGVALYCARRRRRG
jgi:hypothetical protein